jgi:hypothetical protein
MAVSLALRWSTSWGLSVSASDDCTACQLGRDLENFGFLKDEFYDKNK